MRKTILSKYLKLFYKSIRLKIKILLSFDSYKLTQHKGLHTATAFPSWYIITIYYFDLAL